MPLVIFLSETLGISSKVDNIILQLGFDFMHIIDYLGCSGGLVLF